MTNGCLRATVSPAILIFPAIRQRHARLSVLNPASIRSACATHRPMLTLTTHPHIRAPRWLSFPALFPSRSFPLADTLARTSVRRSLNLSALRSVLSFPLSHSPHRSCFRPALLRVPGLFTSPATRCDCSFRWRKSAGGYTSAIIHSSDSCASCCSKNSGFDLRIKATTSASPSLNLAKSSL